MDQDELQWLRQYRKGDVAGLERLMERYRRPLYGFILKMSERRADADECFQEVWIRAIRNLPAFREKNLLGWLFRIAHNLLIDEARKRRIVAPLAGAGMKDVEGCVPEPPAGGISPAEEAAGRDLGLRIDQAVQRLSPEQREVFWMRMHGDVPFKTIARIQKVSINTALARMQYALRKLREELKEDYRLLSGESR